MKLPRDLNGWELVAKLSALGFEEVRQSGSHLLIKHLTSGETVSVPAHRPLKVGTLNGILRDVQELTGLSRDEVLVKLR